MTNKVLNLLKDSSFVVPKVLLKRYKELKITEIELLVLICLISNNEFDPGRIQKELSIPLEEIMKHINNLCDKDLIKIISLKEGNLMNEIISLDELYNKLTLIIINEEEKQSTTIYDNFEKEFGRTLSPMEYEIIGAWIEEGFNEELVLSALKEATYNGVSNLRYIDKILHEWQKKGIKNKNEIKIKNIKKETKKGETFEYDWLNEED